MYNQPWGYPPQQPVVFIPPQPNPPVDRIAEIEAQITSLEYLKKRFKEEKKEDKKDDKDKGGDPKIINVALLFILISPITGPIMSHFFAWGLSLLPH